MSTKKIFLTLFILFSAFSVYSQKVKEADVPSAVKTKFTSMYPNAGSTKWEMENGNYEAEFKNNSTETSAIFEPNGNYVQTEVEIPVSSLPAGVSDYVSKTLKSKNIKEAAQITSANDTVTYEAEIGNEDYLFDANGNFLRKDTDTGDTEDEDKK